MTKHSKLTSSIKKKAKNIELLIMDVDGVLTPGYMVYADSGEQVKLFNVQDGFGVMLWRKAGLKSAIVTAGNAGAVDKRAETLKIDKVYQGAMDKRIAYDILKKDFSLLDEQICFIGDDLIDLPILKRVGLACCVANGHKDIFHYADYITESTGGKGAVREVIDIILKSKGLWDKVTENYFKS